MEPGKLKNKRRPNRSDGRRIRMEFTVPLRSRINDFFDHESNPFEDRRPSIVARLFADVVTILERFLGTTVLIKAYGDDFDFVDAKLKRLIQRLLDHGILESFGFKKVFPDWPDLIYAESALKPIPLPSGIERKLGGTVGSGCGFDHNTAVRKALAEALERYSLSIHNPANFIWGSFRELSQPAVDPLLFQCFSEKQLADSVYQKNHAFDHNSPFHWVKAVSLIDDKPCLIPAQLGVLLYEIAESEPLIREINTSGAAAGTSWAMAAYNAVCETIERDALLIFWLNRLTPPRIDPQSVRRSDIRGLLEVCRVRNIEVVLSDITTDAGVPTVLAIARDPGGTLPLHVAPRADLDIEQAIFDAIRDCLKLGVVAAIPGDQMEQVSAIASQIRTLEQRAIFWSDPHRLRDAEFLWMGKMNQVSKNAFLGCGYSEKLAALKKILSENGWSTYLLDVTTDIARGAGLMVVMSLLPQAYPLYLNEHYKYLGVKRLYQAPVRMGYLTKPHKEEDINPIPHPML